jgi:hypothetical protein
MKNILLTGLIFTIVTSTFGQEKEPDTTRINLGSNELIIVKREKDKKDSVELNIKMEKKQARDGCWAGVDFGVTMLMNKEFKTSFPLDPHWENDPAKSFYWNINAFDHRFNIYKQNIGITTGLGVNFTQIGFKKGYLLQDNGDSLWATRDTINNYSKNKLKAFYLQVPLLLEFNTSNDPKKSFYFATGVVAGVRLSSKLKRKIENENFSTKDKIKGTYGLNPFKLDALLRVGHKDWGLFASYDLIPLFDTQKTSAVYPFNFGISYNF